MINKPTIIGDNVYIDKAVMAEKLRDIVKPGDVLLFKGSRGMKMEQILELFLQEK